jgi:hypothetical protein
VRGHSPSYEQLLELEESVDFFSRVLGNAIAGCGVPLVGATTSFQQTAASIALLAEVKAARPQTTTVLGGANCRGAMAFGIAALTNRVDCIVSGESETVFVDLLRGITSQPQRMTDRIILGRPCRNLDSLPDPEFHEYFRQLDHALPSWRQGMIWLPFESSRRCWWGQKHQCTFCGLNGETISFRVKSPDRVLRTLKTLGTTHPIRNLVATDNILPQQYLKTLLPKLSHAVPDAQIFYSTKAISFEASRADEGIRHLCHPARH